MRRRGGENGSIFPQDKDENLKKRYSCGPLAGHACIVFVISIIMWLWFDNREKQLRELLFASPKANFSAINSVLDDPERLAQHIKAKFTCALPTNNRCGHDSDFFHIFERNGLHILPVHFYSVIPKLSDLDIKKFQRPDVPAEVRTHCSSDPTSPLCPIPKLPGLDLNLKKQVQTVEGCHRLWDELAQIPSLPLLVNGEPAFHTFWSCSQKTPQGQACPPFGSIDAEMYQCFIRGAAGEGQHMVKKIIEIGSGHSTYAAVDALRRNSKEQGHLSSLIAIEPYPSAELRMGFEGINFKLMEQGVQEVDLSVFRELESGDILFIDSTHVVSPGSDVVYIFTRILPELAPGVLVHVHDICLPFETAWDWTFKDYRFWNEQYLLHAFLLNNDDWEILYMGALWEHYMPDKLAKILPLLGSNGSFWMRRRTKEEQRGP